MRELIDKIKNFDQFLSEKTNIKITKIKSFETDEGHFSVYDINDTHHNRGDMFTVFEDKNGWIIRNVLIPNDIKRNGIATDFYLKMNDLSKSNTNHPLKSTQPRKLSNGEVVHELSNDAQLLWDSFVRKGLVKKISDKNYTFND